MPNYRTVRVPEELVDTVLKIIKENKELGYRTHSEFIIEAIRRRVEDFKKNNKKEEK